jgi:hypothetical protein
LRTKTIIAILTVLVIIFSSASAYALWQKKDEKNYKTNFGLKLKVKDMPAPLLQDGIFTAEIGIEKDKEPLYYLNGNYQMKDKIISCDGTVISGEKEGEFSGIFKGKDYFELKIIIQEKTITFSGKYKFDKNKKDFNGIWWNNIKCFEFVYPISYMMPDGTMITGNSEKELLLEIKEWYTANPNVKEKPILQYPVDIKFKDGTLKTINNDMEMKKAYEECGDKEYGWIAGTFQGNDNPRTVQGKFPILTKLLKMSIFRDIFLKILQNL